MFSFGGSYSDLKKSLEDLRCDHDALMRENEALKRRVEKLERLVDPQYQQPTNYRSGGSNFQSSGSKYQSGGSNGHPSSSTNSSGFSSFWKPAPKIQVDIFSIGTQTAFGAWEQRNWKRNKDYPKLQIVVKGASLPSETTGLGEVAILVSFSPTDRWFDSLNGDFVRGLLERYKGVFLVLEKLISNPSQLAPIASEREFAKVLQICVNSKNETLEVPHNQDLADDLIATIVSKVNQWKS